ncbi:MAG TPA: hypothetical protein VEJ63_20970, partial [Planctomycetota bacterium]|nr:hypothetical protein [Planctomycetota bacterium]
MSTPAAESLNVSAPTAPRKRRRVWAWCIATLLLLLLLPIFAYFGVIAYISMGYLNDSVAEKIGAVFNQKATVGAVNSPWLTGLRIDRIRVDTTDSERPLKVGSVVIDWDIADLYNENRIRSVNIDRPVIHLRRDDKGAWNLALQPAEPREPAYKIER